MALSEDDPYVEELLGDAPRAAAAAARGASCARDGARARCCSSPSPRSRSWRPRRAALSPLGAVGLIAAYALAQQVRFDVGAGYTVPTQLVLMPMLLARAARARAAARRRGLLVGAPAGYLRGDVHPTRLVFVLARRLVRRRARASSWRCSRPPLGLGDWPVLALALASQVALRRRRHRRCASGSRSASRPSCSCACSCGSSPSTSRSRRSACSPASPPAPAAGRRARAAAHGPARPLRARARARIDNALALSHAYRGTALLMSDLLEADDAYTGGEHSHGVVALALAVGDALGLDARDRRNLEFGALLHDIGKLRVPNEIINKPGKLTDEEWELIKRHPGRRAGDARARRRRARRGRDHRPPPPRALGRRAATPTASPARRSRSRRGSSAPATPTAR